MHDDLLVAMAEREIRETEQLVLLVAAATLDSLGKTSVVLHPAALARLAGRVTREALPDGGWRISLGDAVANSGFKGNPWGWRMDMPDIAEKVSTYVACQLHPGDPDAATWHASCDPGEVSHNWVAAQRAGQAAIEMLLASCWPGAVALRSQADE